MPTRFEQEGEVDQDSLLLDLQYYRTFREQTEQ